MSEVLLLLFVLIILESIGIGMGNPGVEKGYPHPNPEIPLPSIPDRGILGLG